MNVLGIKRQNGVEALTNMAAIKQYLALIRLNLFCKIV